MSASYQDQKKINQSSSKNENEEQEAVRVHGFQQIVDMLRVADPAFRESLLKRIAQRDQRLAASLRDAT